MNSRLKIKGKILTHLLYPLILAVISLIAGIVIVVHKNITGIILVGLSLIYIAVVLVMYFINKPVVLNELIKFAVNYAQVQKELLKDLAVPYGLIDITGNILWDNYELQMLLSDSGRGKNIFQEAKGLPEDVVILHEGEVKEAKIVLNDRNYRVQFKRINTRNIFENSPILEIQEGKDYMIAVYFFDETEITALIKENADEKLVAGLIYIDNYEEALQSVEEVRASLLTALIDRRINKFISNINGILKKTEKDKYFIAFKHKYLEGLQADKFSIIDDVKTVNVGNEMNVTISIGLGVGGETYAQNTDYARMAMDLALGRGGDQAVLKDGGKIYYYGGKSKQVEKNTRVKARVKAHALRELLIGKDKVLIMGHQIQDIDSLGAGIGIYRASKSLGKKVHIVLNEITTSIRPMVERFMKDDEYEKDLFVTSSEAVELVDSTTVVIVVDVNRPSYTECPELLRLCKSVVVLDHHRQTSESIENALLSYIEPYASSASEMVAEILQYIQDGIKVRQVEADAMYGGIMIDTNNFSNKTGVRTFEAAAFLRRCGADVTRVRMMFRNDVNDYRARAQAVSRAEIYMDNFAVAECPSEGVESPTVVCAQAANELLNINGINASFVFTEYNDKIYISARSIDDINVQLIMERIGGGGHMNVAGAQLENTSMEEAKELVKNTLKEMLENKEI
ncbi:MAG: DHH family phosphoesterase [Lachnospiraceae bacterium]